MVYSQWPKCTWHSGKLVDLSHPRAIDIIDWIQQRNTKHRVCSESSRPAATHETYNTTMYSFPQ